MSRSKKKNPYISLCCVKPETHKWYKAARNRVARRMINGNPEIDAKSAVKLIRNDWGMQPGDGKQIWETPKGYRK